MGVGGVREAAFVDAVTGYTDAAAQQLARLLSTSYASGGGGGGGQKDNKSTSTNSKRKKRSKRSSSSTDANVDTDADVDAAGSTCGGLNDNSNGSCVSRQCSGG